MFKPGKGWDNSWKATEASTENVRDESYIRAVEGRALTDGISALKRKDGEGSLPCHVIAQQVDISLQTRNRALPGPTMLTP